MDDERETIGRSAWSGRGEKTSDLLIDILALQLAPARPIQHGRYSERSRLVFI